MKLPPGQSLQQKFLLRITLIIVPVLGIVFSWVAVQGVRQGRSQALDKARIIARQVVLTRQWITDCGGMVMVPAHSPGARGVACPKEHQLSMGGIPFQRFSPAMVTRKLSQYASREKDYSFSLSSLTPMNPDNRPNPFETWALGTFIQEGGTEAHRFEKNHLDYMVPLFVETGCLACHHRDAIAPNGIMGGLSVLIPLDKMTAAFWKNGVILAISGFCLTALTIVTLFVLMQRLVLGPLKVLEDKTREIGSGNLNARVQMNTGDELEHLAHGLNAMAKTLATSRNAQEIRIEQATRDLALAHEELKALDRLKSDFLTNMSHELRSPITVIRGGINYLQRTVENKEDRRYIHIMDKNISRLTRLVYDMFDFTKLEAGKIEWDFNRENLTDLVGEVMEIISPLALEKQLDIRFHHPGKIFVSMDFERMEQVLVNIMDNAIKFSHVATPIIINMALAPDIVTLSIMNHGPGIAPDNIDLIFEKFSTVPSGRNGNTEGTGLGLAISKAIVTAHAGKIWAESVEGETTTFFLTLPVIP